MTTGLTQGREDAAARPAAGGSGAPGQATWLTPQRALLAVAALTALAFVLRLAGIGQSLVDDEIFTYDIVTRFGFGDILSQVRDTSITPPLHYLVAHVAVQVGDPTLWVRVPSLLLGAATVPLVYLVGSRTVGRGAAVLGSALLALSPMAVWYGDEARAYATLTFVALLSTYTLLRALEPGRRRWAWWLVFVLASAGVLYTHYTGVFVLIAQTAWAAWACLAEGSRRRLGELALATVLIVVAYLPWIPAYHDQHNNKVGILAINFLHPLNWHTAWENVAKLLVGQPFEPWDDLLGAPGLVLIGIGLAALAAGWVVNATDPGASIRLRPRPSGTVLVAMLAVATPVALLLYGIFDTSLYAPRNLLASLPGMCLLLGAAVVGIRPPFRTVAAVALIGAVALTSAEGLRVEHHRPPFDKAGAYLDREAGPRDAVLLLQAGSELFGRNPALRSLELGMDRPHPFLATGVVAERDRYRDTLRRAATRRRLFVVVAPVPGVPESILRERLGPGFRLVSQRSFPGFAPIRVAEYVPVREGGGA